MHSRRSLAVVALAFLVTLACAAPAPAAVAVGTVAPAFSLTDLDGNTVSLADHRGKTVVLEWINPNCPVSDRHAREATMTDLVAKHRDVVWLAINSTSEESGELLAPAEHKEWAAERGIDYTILYDESGEVGRAYGARTTPHMYIVDAEGKLAYNGAIDDDPPGRKDKAARGNYVDAGLIAHAAGQAIDPATTRPYGCSVKYAD
ncbi:MAG TPA: thioredoxin family protein [Thermoanaerobaculia bacterium]|nr:thioredoxin family protein [Thermoanaerobaculia bacterium]